MHRKRQLPNNCQPAIVQYHGIVLPLSDSGSLSGRLAWLGRADGSDTHIGHEHVVEAEAVASIKAVCQLRLRHRAQTCVFGARGGGTDAKTNAQGWCSARRRARRAGVQKLQGIFALATRMPACARQMDRCEDEIKFVPRGKSFSSCQVLRPSLVVACAPQPQASASFGRTAPTRSTAPASIAGWCAAPGDHLTCAQRGRESAYIMRDRAVGFDELPVFSAAWLSCSAACGLTREPQAVHATVALWPPPSGRELRSRGARRVDRGGPGPAWLPRGHSFPACFTCAASSTLRPSCRTSWQVPIGTRLFSKKTCFRLG